MKNASELLWAASHILSNLLGSLHGKKKPYPGIPCLEDALTRNALETHIQEYCLEYRKRLFEFSATLIRFLLQLLPNSKSLQSYVNLVNLTQSKKRLSPMSSSV
jgi:hypothetical protein